MNRPLICLLCLLTFATSAIAQEKNHDWQLIAVQKYPELGVKDSDFNKRFLETYTQRKATDPAFFTSPNWPLTLATEIASQRPATPPDAPSSAGDFSDAVTIVLTIVGGLLLFGLLWLILRALEVWDSVCRLYDLVASFFRFFFGG